MCPNCDSEKYYQRCYIRGTAFIDDSGNIVEIIDKDIVSRDQSECFECGYRSE